MVNTPEPGKDKDETHPNAVRALHAPHLQSPPEFHEVAFVEEPMHPSWTVTTAWPPTADDFIAAVHRHLNPTDEVGTALTDSDAEGMVTLRLSDSDTQVRLGVTKPMLAGGTIRAGDLVALNSTPVDAGDAAVAPDPGKPRVLGLIAAERLRAHAKHGQDSMESPDWRADRRLRIVTEELGEVARVLNDLEITLSRLEYTIAGDAEVEAARRKLVKELTQTASTLYAWAANAEGDILPLTGFGQVR
jgi:hypothetical protein